MNQRRQQPPQGPPPGWGQPRPPQGPPPGWQPRGPATPQARPFWKRWWVIALAAVVLIAILAQLQPDAAPVAAPATTPATTAPAVTTTTPPPAQTTSAAPVSTAPAPTEAKCEAVPDGIVERITGAFKKTPTIQATQMQVGDPTTFVAVKFSLPGAENEIAVFAVLGMKSDGTGAILAADGFAKEFTTYFDAATSAAKISGGDARIGAVKKCLQ